MSAFYSCSNIVIVVFDKSNRQSFENIGNWVEEAKSRTDSNTSFMLLGSKFDLEPEVSTDEAVEKALEYEMIYFEVSLKSDVGIHEMIEVIVRDKFKKKKKLEKEKEKEEEN